MKLYAAIVYIFSSTTSTSAVPISHVLRDSIPPDLNFLPSQCICPSQQRSFWDILWSCLATIFACTWVSVHPNIPPSGEKWWKTGLRRLELMFWALIAPEMIIYWAVSQWYGVREMVKKYHGHGWTKTHAYFVQMGGFTLFEGGKPQHVLLPEKMEELLLAGQIDLPQITEEEIRDRSKGDGLSKALVIGQTSWFVTQCVARLAQGLILTELELVTGAFAVLNGVMYFLWWNKPLGVRCPVPVHLLPEAKEKPFKFNLPEKTAPSIWGTRLLPSYSGFVGFVTSSPTKIRKSMESLKNTDPKAVLDDVIIIVSFPLTLIWLFFARLDDIYLPYAVQEAPGSVSTVSTFYATGAYSGDTPYSHVPVVGAASIIAALFGCLHCVGWFFTFQTRAELIIWGVCSVIITIIPLGILANVVALSRADQAEYGSDEEKLFKILGYTFGTSLLFLPIYVIARLLLLGEAFAGLRYLPPDALAVVDWLSFLPHI